MKLLERFRERGLVKSPIEVPSDILVHDEQEYETLAKKAGFKGHRAVMENLAVSRKRLQFRQFLAENGITIYPFPKVERYMCSLLHHNQRWLWRSVEAATPRHTRTLNRFGSSGDRTWAELPPYDKPIPDAVLMTMVKIREAFPTVMFSVTDIIDVKAADPFLATSLDGEEWFIIERWDEPKFRM